MARNTIVDVREKVAKLNESVAVELSFDCWGTGQNRYHLTNAETGETYGPICIGASEFLTFLQGFAARGRVA